MIIPKLHYFIYEFYLYNICGGVQVRYSYSIQCRYVLYSKFHSSNVIQNTIL